MATCQDTATTCREIADRMSGHHQDVPALWPRARTLPRHVGKLPTARQATTRTYWPSGTRVLATCQNTGRTCREFPDLMSGHHQDVSAFWARSSGHVPEHWQDMSGNALPHVRPPPGRTGRGSGPGVLATCQDTAKACRDHRHEARTTRP